MWTSTSGDPVRSTGLNLVLSVLGLALAYELGGTLGLALPFLGSSISLIWIPSGLAYGSLIRWGRRLWPGVFIGSFAVNFSFNPDVLQSTLIACGSTLGPLIATTILGRARFQHDFASRRDLALFCTVAPLTQVLNAAIGVSALRFTGSITADEFLGAAIYWWLGDIVGLMLLAPFVLNVSRRNRALLWTSPATSIAILVTIIVLSFLLFRPHDAASLVRPTTVFLTLPCVAWAAIRCGPLGGSLASMLLTAVALTCTFFDRGPFRPEAAGPGLLELWSYIATSALVSMTFAALRAEGARARDEALHQKRMLEQLTRLQAEFLVTADAKVAFDELLGIIQNQTASPFGFLAMVIRGENGKPAIRMLSITDIAWNERSRALRDLHEEGRLEFHNLKTLFGAALTTERPVIANDPLHDLRSAGTPEDHPRLESFVGLPVHSSGRMIGLLGLANRRGGYPDDFVSTQDVFITACAALLESHLGALAREETEMRLRESEGRLQMALDASNMGIWEWDLSPGGIIWDEGHARLFGIELASFDGRFETVLASVLPEDRGLIEASIEGASPDQPDYDQEFRIRHSDGSIRWMASRGRLSFDEAGKLVSMRGVVTDVTSERESEQQRRELEVQLRQSQKMEAIGTLAGGIAHDFNNILGAIIGNVELAQEIARSDEAVEDCLEDILVAGRRARDLVQRILTFARRQENEKMRISLEPVVREALALMRSTIPASVSVALDIEDDCPCVIADATQIHQIMVNLLTNASQALRNRQGRIEVSLGKTEVRKPVSGLHGSLAVGTHVVLSISDDGPGIPQEYGERIFEPFFSTKKLGEGTGLGLSVVHGIVMAHDAYLTMTSEVGRGTEFQIYFKMAAGQPNLPSLVTAAGGVPMLGRRVLLVDDEPAIGKVVKTVLERRGITVLHYQDPRAALAVLGDDPRPFDLLVTDLTMPGLSGMDLIERVQRFEPPVPAILMTGHLDQNNAARLRRMSGVASILKPFSPGELMDLIERSLSNERSVV